MGSGSIGAIDAGGGGRGFCVASRVVISSVDGSIILGKVSWLFTTLLRVTFTVCNSPDAPAGLLDNKMAMIIQGRIAHKNLDSLTINLLGVKVNFIVTGLVKVKMMSGRFYRYSAVPCLRVFTTIHYAYKSMSS